MDSGLGERVVLQYLVHKNIVTKHTIYTGTHTHTRRTLKEGVWMSELNLWEEHSS